MRRREFVAALSGGIATAPFGVPKALGQPQASRPRRVGFLSPQSQSSAAPFLAALRQGLADAGWIEGQNLAFEVRYADGAIDRLPRLAADLVGQNIDVIVAGSNAGVSAAKRATNAIPIVMATTGNPINDSLVESLAHPGGNVTGVTAITQELSAKRLELIKEALPGVTRIALLINPDSPYTAAYRADAAPAAQTVGVELQTVEARIPSELPAAFAAMRSGRAQALMLPADIMFNTEYAQIVALAADSQLPAIYSERAFVSAGGLMFYGAGLTGIYRHAAAHVDKILRGAQPGDLPVEQPTTFELVINLRTAAALGLSIPPTLLARADEVIE
jgi:putative ABC transport system substrate-binding protein